MRKTKNMLYSKKDNIISFGVFEFVDLYKKHIKKQILLSISDLGLSTDDLNIDENRKRVIDSAVVDNIRVKENIEYLDCNLNILNKLIRINKFISLI